MHRIRCEWTDGGHRPGVMEQQRDVMEPKDLRVRVNADHERGEVAVAACRRAVGHAARDGGR